MSEFDEAKYFSKLGQKLGLCVKDQEKKVLFQNAISESTCGKKVGEICQQTCATLYPQVEECAAVTEGMKLFKATDFGSRKLDAMIVNDGETITTLLYPLDEDQEKFKKQEVFFRERGLTKSELRIMQMVMQGMTNSAIAKNLFISKSTLKTHLNNIYKKLPASMRPSQVRH